VGHLSGRFHTRSPASGGDDCLHKCPSQSPTVLAVSTLVRCWLTDKNKATIIIIINAVSLLKGGRQSDAERAICSAEEV
jgi:hypothetical protein